MRWMVSGNAAMLEDFAPLIVAAFTVLATVFAVGCLVTVKSELERRDKRTDE